LAEDITKTIATPAVRVRSGEVVSGKFRIGKQIGRGGMGVVYEAEDLKLGRTVALKFLPAALTGDADARERFVLEARAASGLDHPNICAIHEIGETEAGEMFIAMACYKGESLKDRLEQGPLPPNEVLDIAVQTAEGLAKAHELGIVHRDIKPGNIFLTSDGTVKILDFGLAKLAGQVKLTRPGSTLGTAAYMSPEQVRGEDVGPGTDVWSLGVVLYEMMTGGLPFPGENVQAVLHAVLNEPALPVRNLRAGFPGGIESLVRRALAKDPARRFPSARRLAEALQALGAGVAPKTRSTARRLVFPRPRRRLAIVSAASVLTLAGIAVGIWMLSRPSLAFESRDKLMVADVDNQTGEEVFDLALRTAIEADLQQSPYAAVFDKPQITETLKLMRMAPTAKVDEEVGCEVCRFAGVRALVLPRILSAGEAYELQAILVDPVKRRHVERIRVTAMGREDVLLHAIDSLAGRLRARLGESLGSIDKADKPVVRVTTSSWDALNYFSLGMAKWQEAKFKEAGSLMQLALEKDAQFVEARSSLALLDLQFLGRSEEGKEMLRQALRDAEAQDLPQRDVLKLKAVNRQFVDGDLPGALETYGMIREVFPDFMPAWNNSGMILRSLGRYDEAVAMYEKAAALAPHNSVPLYNLWFTHLDYRRDPKTSESVARRMVELSPGMAYSHNALGYSLAVQGRFEEALRELRRTVEIEPAHAYGLPNLAHVLLASGKPAEAATVYREVYGLALQGRATGTVDKDGFDLALALKESGNSAEAAKIAAECRSRVLDRSKGRPTDVDDLSMLGLLAAAAGDSSQAAGFLEKIDVAGEKDAYTLMNIATLQALLGRTREAVETMKKSYAAGYFDYFFPVILPGLRSLRNDSEFRALLRLQ